MSKTKPNAVILYLTQNTEVRRTYLKTSLYFLFRNFNDQYRYPVMIMHEGDYDDLGQQDILMSVRASCRDLVTFHALDVGDFVVPEHVDQDKMARCIAMQPTPYWRNVKYRLMCRWWLVHMPRYVAAYDYVMRLDDDSIIEEPIKRDMFAWAADKDLVYASNMVHVDCGMCCYGMRDLFARLFPDRPEVIQRAFVEQTINIRTVQHHGFRSLLSLTLEPLPTELPMNIQLPMPIMYYNNFHITRPAFWQTPEVKATLDAIDATGNIFYYRWGDAPLQSLIVLLHSKPEQVDRCVFKYSKRLQREAFLGDDKKYWSYMPAKYSESSCMTEQRA